LLKYQTEKKEIKKEKTYPVPNEETSRFPTLLLFLIPESSDGRIGCMS